MNKLRVWLTLLGFGLHCLGLVGMCLDLLEVFGTYAVGFCLAQMGPVGKTVGKHLECLWRLAGNCLGSVVIGGENCRGFPWEEKPTKILSKAWRSKHISTCLKLIEH